MAEQGFGVDLSCSATLQTGRLVRGQTLLAQAIYRRLTTPRGTLRGGAEELAYGLDLPGYVGQTDPDTAAASLPTLIEGELAKDDRIVSVAATITSSTSTDGMTTFAIVVDVVPVGEADQFALTLDVSDVGLDIIGGVS